MWRMKTIYLTHHLCHYDIFPRYAMHHCLHLEITNPLACFRLGCRRCCVRDRQLVDEEIGISWGSIYLWTCAGVGGREAESESDGEKEEAACREREPENA